MDIVQLGSVLGTTNFYDMKCAFGWSYGFTNRDLRVSSLCGFMTNSEKEAKISEDLISLDATIPRGPNV
jgi:hypothetical protein